MSRIPDLSQGTTSGLGDSRRNGVIRQTRIVSIRTFSEDVRFEDSLGESGYESILSSTSDATLTDERPPYTSTPLTLVGLSLTDDASPATPLRPSQMHISRALFHKDILTSIHGHEPKIFQKILDYLQPKDLHNLIQASLRWRPYVKEHSVSWKRLTAYRDEIAARRENIPLDPLVRVHHDVLDTARASFAERTALRSLQNIHIVEQRALSLTIEVRQPEPARPVPRPPPAVSVRRPASTSAKNNREKMRRLRRL